MFAVSIVIPVYNAEEFIGRAVESALLQGETSEIILIEDGSYDNSLKICRELEKKNPKVKLFQHPEGINQGASASRNLGIKEAKSKFIAFLDADDIYLENRFEKDKKIFMNNSNAEGVYNCIGTKYDDDLEKNYKKRFNSRLTTLSAPVKPNELFDVLIGKHPEVTGHFSLISLTIKKDVISQIGYFNEKLRLHQDTEWCFRLASACKLYPGNISTPVSLRRVHKNNRYINNTKHNYTRFLMYSEIIRSSFFSTYSYRVKWLFLRRLLFYFRKDISVSTIKELPITLLSFFIGFSRE